MLSHVARWVDHFASLLTGSTVDRAEFLQLAARQIGSRPSD